MSLSDGGVNPPAAVSGLCCHFLSARHSPESLSPEWLSPTPLPSCFSSSPSPQNSSLSSLPTKAHKATMQRSLALSVTPSVLRGKKPTQTQFR